MEASDCIESAGLFAVIALPVLAPLAALLQLLFPGLLKDQWQQYRVAIAVLMSQSTLLVLQWALVTWAFPDGAWWLRDAAVAALVAALAVIGAVIAFALSRWPDEWGDLPAYGEPTLFEGVAIGVFVVVGLVWMLIQAFSGQPVIDQMTVATAGCAAGVLHLGVRRFRPQWAITQVTEVVMLGVMTIVGGWLAWGLHAAGDVADYESGVVADGAWRSEWPTHRRDNARRGSDGADATALTRHPPALLWTFEPKLGSLDVEFHASPAVVDGYLVIGARATIITESRGYLFCIRTRDEPGATPPQMLAATVNRPPGLAAADVEPPPAPLPAGSLVWRLGGTGYRPIFASPIVSGGKIFIGEGYHQHRNCRMMVVDPAQPKEPIAVFATASHTESSPAIVGSRAIFGAGDDGLYCVDFAPLPPRKIWQVERVHVDGSPLVVDGQAYVGAVVGDIYADLAVLCVDLDEGQVRWRFPTDLPPAASPALSGPNLVIGLGNGKFGQDAEQPAGALLAIDRKRGTQAWRFDTPGSVLNAAAVADDRIVFTCRDRHVYCLDAARGKLLWKRPFAAPMSAAPAIAGNAAIVVAADGTIACLDLRDGEIRWQFDKVRAPEYEAIASPVVMEGRLYVAIGNRIHCLGQREVP